MTPILLILTIIYLLSGVLIARAAHRTFKLQWWLEWLAAILFWPLVSIEIIVAAKRNAK